MNKEFFKTALLNILVFLSVILAFNIWFDKELWSQGDYSSFVYSLEKIFPSLKKDVYIDDVVLSPQSRYGIEWFSVSENNKKSAIYFGDGDFKKFFNQSEVIRTSLIQSGAMAQISREDYINASKGGNITFRFNTHVPLKEYFSDKTELFGDYNPLSDTLIFTTGGTKYIYFEDFSNAICYRIPVLYNTKELSSLITKTTASKRIPDSFAFELNFDKPTDVSRILFDSFVPITTESKSIYKVEAHPIQYNSQEAFDAVFKAFNIKKNSARTYKDTDNVVNYIGNYSSLKIRENGSFTFEAESPKRGVNIGKGSLEEDILKFSNGLYRSITNSDGILVLKSIEENEGQTHYNLTYASENAKLYMPDVYGAKVTVTDGYITHYEHTPLKIQNSNDAFFSGSVIEAYDALYKTEIYKEKSDLTIMELSPVNYYKDGVVVQKWYIEFSDGSYYFL